MLADMEVARACEALQGISPDLARDEWVKIAMASKAAGIEFDTFNAWSAQGATYSERDCSSMWRSIKSNAGIGPGTLFMLAREAGGTPNGRRERSTTGNSPWSAACAPARPSPAPGLCAADVWNRCEPCPASHSYAESKQGTVVGLRMVPLSDKLRIAGLAVAGWLVVPVLPLAGGAPISLQFIPPTGGTGKKLNLPGAAVDGVFVVGELQDGGTAYLCEGIGQAWACWRATGAAAVVCFGWGRIRSVATELRQRDASARLVLVPDVGKENEAETIARGLAVQVAAMPQGWPRNADVNDLVQRDGLEALKMLLSRSRAPEVKSPLSVVFAADLPDEFTPPDEIVEGVLTAGGGSMLYGDSNSGKTFLAIDIAAAVARGVRWMGKRTEPGLVIYLAAESPASVRGRLQAYSRHHGVTAPNFAIVQSPIDLFDGEADTDAVIDLVRQIEASTGKRARLIVGDTLARLSAGANENAGQDMGLVVRRFDRIRAECNAHFMLVHHSGKSAAAGARGWSGIRAAMDTEIEVTASPSGRCAEITKQRDLPTKGLRIGFGLKLLELGHTKWGEPATSCVVLPTDLLDRPTGKRTGVIDVAILAMLRTKTIGIKKREVVEHFDGRYDSSSVYRALKQLVVAGKVKECDDGDVSIVTGGGAKGAN